MFLQNIIKLMKRKSFPISRLFKRILNVLRDVTGSDGFENISSCSSNDLKVSKKLIRSYNNTIFV